MDAMVCGDGGGGGGDAMTSGTLALHFHSEYL